MPALRLPATTANRRLVDITLPVGKAKKGLVGFAVYAGPTAAPDQLVAGPFDFDAAAGIALTVGFPAGLGEFVEVRAVSDAPLPADLALKLTPPPKV